MEISLGMSLKVSGGESLEVRLKRGTLESASE